MKNTKVPAHRGSSGTRSAPKLPKPIKRFDNPLTNHQVDYICARVPGYLGCMPDLLAAAAIKKAMRTKKDFAVISNIQGPGEPGSHWVLIIRRDGRLLYIDPLGYTMEDVIRNALGKKSVPYIESRLQLTEGYSCGHFCCVLAWFPAMIEVLSVDQADNERKIIPVFNWLAKNAGGTGPVS